MLCNCGKAECMTGKSYCEPCLRAKLEAEETGAAIGRFFYARVQEGEEGYAQNERLRLRVIDENLFLDIEENGKLGREEFFRMKRNLQEGNVLYLHSIFDLGWNKQEIMKEWKDICYRIKADIVHFTCPSSPLVHDPYVDTTCLYGDKDDAKDIATEFLEIALDDENFWTIGFEYSQKNYWRDYLK